MGYNGIITNDERGNDMHRCKKGLGLGLALALLLSVLVPALPRAAAVEYILEPALLKGSDYTDSDHLAMALDEVLRETLIFIPMGLIQQRFLCRWDW
jgi:hypothetical protein